MLVETHREEHPEGIEVFNFRVEGTHSYFVREQGSTSEPVWVHNANYRQVDYETYDLAQDVIQARARRPNPMTGANGAIGEYRLPSGDLKKSPVFFSKYQGPHSEELLHAWFQANDIEPGMVARIFTEREPCMLYRHWCAERIVPIYQRAGAEITWAFEYGNSASRARGNAALAAALARIFGGRA